MLKSKLSINFSKELNKLSYEKQEDSISIRFKLNVFAGMVYVGCYCVIRYEDGVTHKSNDVNLSRPEDGCDFNALISRCFESARYSSFNKEVYDLVKETELYVLEKLEGEF